MPGVAAHATLIKQGATSVVNVTDISGPSLSRDTIETTSHDTADIGKTYIGGLLDGGEVTMTINFDAGTTDHVANIIEEMTATAVVSWVIEFASTSTNATSTFDAWITGFEPTAPNGDKLSADITLKVTGIPAWVE